MKHVASKLTLAGMLALSSLITTPMTRAAASTDAQAARQAALKAKHDALVLKKYDKNGNGVLDPDELARKAANEARMKVLREARQRKAAERAQAARQAAPAPAAAAN